MARKPSSPEAGPEADAADPTGLPLEPDAMSLLAGDDASAGASLSEAAPADDPAPSDASAGAPEVVVVNDLPVQVSHRWLAEDGVLVVSLALLPGWRIIAATDGATVAPDSSPADVPIDPATLIDHRMLDDGSVIGVTRDGRKVRGRLA